MTLLTTGARRRNVPQRPYNAATYLTTPTYYAGNDAAVHPSVVDMGGEWNGYRYWMAMTPYPSWVDDWENPSILASADGLTWVVPAGLTNPIDPFPGGAAYNSDPDLVYDPDSDRMICLWRHYTGVSGATDNLVFCYSESTDGVTWTAQTDIFATTFPNDGALFSPAILRVGAGDWRMWNAASYGAPSAVRTATNIDGPWSANTYLTFNGTNAGGVTGGFWHWDVMLSGGVFYGAVSTNIGSLTAAKIYAFTSTDGIAWALNTTPILESRTGEWDERLYRPTLTMGEGGVMRVWYSAQSYATDWRIGHTEVPLSEWPTPPAT